MEYFVYIIKSKKNGRTYVGSTSNIAERLLRHNGGQNKSTRPYRSWGLIYSEKLSTRSDAQKREYQIKSYKGGRAFKALLE